MNEKEIIKFNITKEEIKKIEKMKESMKGYKGYFYKDINEIDINIISEESIKKSKEFFNNFNHSNSLSIKFSNKHINKEQCKKYNMCCMCKNCLIMKYAYALQTKII